MIKGPEQRRPLIGQTLAMIDARIAELRAEGVPDDEPTPKEVESHEEKTRRFMAESRVPERYLDASVKAWRPAEPIRESARQKIADWAIGVDKRDWPSLVLTGGVGTGKTWIVCGVANDRSTRLRASLYTTAKAYTGKIKDSYRKGSGESEAEILEAHASSPLLIVDEVGRQFETENEKMYLFELINERYNRRMPTLFVSNLTDAEFKAFIGASATDRIREGGGRVLNLNWESLRKSQ